MRLSLSLRIFLVHLAFTLAAGAIGVAVVRQTFERYFERWERGIATLPAEQLFQPIANEVARSLLLRREKLPEVRERDQARIALGLQSVLRELPSIEAIYILDVERRIQYASQEWALDLGFTGPEAASFFASETIVRRQRPSGTAGTVTEVMVPIFDDPDPGREPRRRLGSVVAIYRPDPALNARIPALTPPSFRPNDYAWILIVLVAAVAAGGLVVAGLAALPVRRLDRAIRDFRERGFRGKLEVDGLGSELAGAAKAINEMGGRLEALDVTGRERESLLATLSQSLEEGMIALDAARKPVAWNEAALRLLCDEAAPVINAVEEPQDARLGAALAKHPELIAEAEGVDVVDLGFERAGEEIHIRATRVPFERGPGETGTLILLRDLATLRKVESHLLEAGRFAVLAHLAGSLAHEIRNPLHSIGLNAGVVQQYVGAPQTEASTRAITESLRTIQEETRRLTDLLNNYLGLMRSTPDSGSVDVRDVCRRVIQLLSYAAMKSRVEIRFEGDAELPAVHGVPDRLQQAILNLVLNAIQAMPQGGVVVLRTTAADNLVRVTVSDTGPGLPREVAEDVFDSGVTTKPGGSGLGLPLVRMIAEAHGGSVWYRSEPGQGTAFTLVLPTDRKAA